MHLYENLWSYQYLILQLLQKLIFTNFIYIICISQYLPSYTSRTDTDMLTIDCYQPVPMLMFLFSNLTRKISINAFSILLYLHLKSWNWLKLRCFRSCRSFSKVKGPLHEISFPQSSVFHRTHFQYFVQLYDYHLSSRYLMSMLANTVDWTLYLES